MSAEGTMLLNMNIEDAKALRRRFGDEKYGKRMRPGVLFMAEAYIEAIDMMNYYDIAYERGEIGDTVYEVLRQGLLSNVINPIRGWHAVKEGVR